MKPVFWFIHVAWLETCQEWNYKEYIVDRKRRAEDYAPHYRIHCVNLVTNEVTSSSLTLSDLAVIHSRQWPRRDKELAEIERLRAKEQRALERKAQTKANLPAKRHGKLLEDQKRWTRKLRLAQTKLRKIKQAINRYERTREDAKEPSPANH